MSGNTLAKPTFVSGPSDDLATVDVYKSATNSSINSISDMVPDSFSDIKDKALKGGKALMNNLPAVLSLAAGGATVLSQKDMLSKVIGSSAVLGTALKSFSPTTAATVFSSISKFSGPAAVMMNSSASLIPGNKSLNDVRSMTSALNAITGTNMYSVTDRSTSIGVAAGMVSAASSLGIPSTFSAFSANQTMAGKLQIASGSMPNLMRAGDMFSMKDMGSVLPPGAMQMMNPNVVGGLSSNYNSPIECKAGDYRPAYTNAMDTFNTIDPNWNKQRRGNGEVIPSITAMQSASPDFMKVLQSGALTSGDPLQQLQVLARSFPASNPAADLAKFFPKTATLPTDRTFNPTIDPGIATNGDISVMIP